MRVLVFMSMLLLLTVVCSVAGLARMVGMPIGGELLTVIVLLAASVGGLGIAIVVAPEPQRVPVRMSA